MRPIALRAAVVISIAVALSPAPASAKPPPGTPKPAGRTRGPAAVREPGWSAHSGPARRDRRGGRGGRGGDGRVDRLRTRSLASPGAGARRCVGRRRRHLLLGRVHAQPRRLPVPPLGRRVRRTGASTTAGRSPTARATPRHAWTACAPAATRATGRSRAARGTRRWSCITRRTSRAPRPGGSR